MLKKMMYRKIAVASSLLLVIMMMYFIPSNKDSEVIIDNHVLEYINPDNLESVYLLDDYNFLSRMVVNINGVDEIDKATSLIEFLTIDGNKREIISNGFKALLPVGTRVIDIKLDNKILTINFSEEFYNVKVDMEDNLIEGLTYTLTSIDGIEKIKILVEGKNLTKMPNSKKDLPEYLDKNFGINKRYELTSLNDVYSYTVYYASNYNEDVYYTPVTKYVNNDGKDKVKIIIDELSSNLTYETNLMSFLDSGVKLLDYEILDDSVRLNFNDLILSDITDSVILEEVMYTIGLSLCDELDVQEVVFLVNNEEISTFSSKSA